ncbi:hypothetical protein BKA66DRAFT_571914 [Pyrenochaeta sp. MPI-SDFR-AT-0127]|nr:hypothetical protein BKA66DRAFT_571914 [Pyrenochaeta sp. MPI-SDFR-AT-0127]
MGSARVVELHVLALDNGNLFLKYGPKNKAEAYAAVHYGYIRNGRYQDRVSRSEDPGGFVFQTFHDMRLTVKRNSYFVTSNEEDDIGKMKISLNLPRMNLIHQYGTKVWAVEFPMSWDYDEWFDAVSSIRETQLSRVSVDPMLRKRRRQKEEREMRKGISDIAEEEWRGDMKLSGVDDLIEKPRHRRVRQERREHRPREEKRDIGGRGQHGRKREHGTEGQQKRHGEAKTRRRAESKHGTRVRHERMASGEKTRRHGVEFQHGQEARRRRREQQRRKEEPRICRIL